MANTSYEECNHQWKFNIDADKSGSYNNKPWMSFFMCKECSTVINLLEKCALDEITSLEKSLRIQENHSRNSMIANFMTASLVFIAFLALIFGEGIFN